MKLIYCPECKDMRSIQKEKITCTCGKSFGYYIGDVEARYGGKAIPVAISNGSLQHAIDEQPDAGKGINFTAFVVARDHVMFSPVAI